ncbi:hypothetical protein H5410_051801 [Solanum commersonii]|uniref:Uncharacterized protein n=1 Tax=Solanum commersonii TaxID=4109 RepID=A0A9J5X1S5_SOLCO|nr:hypothetical protein H5410_051801 [Solanum commersonii]
MAKVLENCCSVCVDIWDVNEGNISKMYEVGSVWIRKVNNDDLSLWCIKLFMDRELGNGDEIGLYWDPSFSFLVFKLLSQTLLSFMSSNTEEESCKVNNTSQNLELTRSLLNRNGVSVHLSDIIEKNDTKKFEDKIFTFRKLSYDDFFLSIVKLIKHLGLGVGDEICYIDILIYQSQFSNYFLRRPTFTISFHQKLKKKLPKLTTLQGSDSRTSADKGLIPCPKNRSRKPMADQEKSYQ